MVRAYISFQFLPMNGISTICIQLDLRHASLRRCFGHSRRRSDAISVVPLPTYDIAYNVMQSTQYKQYNAIVFHVLMPALILLNGHFYLHSVSNSIIFLPNYIKTEHDISLVSPLKG